MWVILESLLYWLQRQTDTDNKTDFMYCSLTGSVFLFTGLACSETVRKTVKLTNLRALRPNKTHCTVVFIILVLSEYNALTWKGTAWYSFYAMFLLIWRQQSLQCVQTSIAAGMHDPGGNRCCLNWGWRFNDIQAKLPSPLSSVLKTEVIWVGKQQE